VADSRPKAWFPYYPADIEADTADLTLEEFGAYQRLLNFHFLQDSIPADPARMALILRLPVQKTRKIWAILSRFFEQRGDRYVQRRMEREIQKSVEKSKVRAEAAHARWGANDHAIADANAYPNADTATATATKVKQKDMSEPAVPACPHLEIISAYHEVLPERPQVIPARWRGSVSERNLQARWRENAEHRTVDFWRDLFGAVRTNDWWMRGDERGTWKGVDLHWLLKRTNFDKAVQHWANLP
jgi:uncharacterized protein YdaU (DUF1376 family)